MATVLESNKTKIAKRVIEVFEFFDRDHSKATVMDIVRRYGRPQSSTSELLASLVEMGLLYKDARSRCYSPTPRLATLGTSAQPRMIRNGRLFEFMDRTAMVHGCSIALIGMVGTHAQIFRMTQAEGLETQALTCGASQRLSASAAGLLLLATQGREQASRMLWRLNAEVPADQKFNHADMCDRIAATQKQGYAVGAAGFGDGIQMVATLLPSETAVRPLVLAAMYPADAVVDVESMRALLVNGLREGSMDQPHDHNDRPQLRVAHG